MPNIYTPIDRTSRRCERPPAEAASEAWQVAISTNCHSSASWNPGRSLIFLVVARWRVRQAQCKLRQRSNLYKSLPLCIPVPPFGKRGMKGDFYSHNPPQSPFKKGEDSQVVIPSPVFLTMTLLDWSNNPMRLPRALRVLATTLLDLRRTHSGGCTDLFLFPDEKFL